MNPVHLAFLAFGICVGDAVGDELSFNRDIRPLLSDACFHCHGPDPAHREADLRLDVEESAKDYAIVAGDLEASDLIARIVSTDPDEVMPPAESGKKLSADQIELLKRWVSEGAKYEPHWAYVAPQTHEVPAVDDVTWPFDPIDHFVLDGMVRNDLRPAADADPATLIRRVSFDLTGLPPSPKLIEEFVADPSRARYVSIVDRLLASPAFGERMAIYWLDLVRFADTVGYHGDQDHNASPYRDYVIDAFNDNLPLDQFTREQLAGDLIVDATEDQKIASGYNRLLQTSHEGGVQPKEYLAIYAADRVRNLSAVWMGATVGCAQCHDHKYDPYTANDFYSLVAFFADLDEAQHFKDGSNALPTKRSPEIPVLARWERGLIAEANQQIASTEQESDVSDWVEIRDRIEKSKRVAMISRSIAPREIRVLPRGNWLDDSGPVVQPTVPAFMPQLAGDGRPSRMDLANWLTDSRDGVGGLTSRVFVNRLWYLLFGRGISSSLSDFGGQGVPPTHPELLDQLAIDFVDQGWNVKRMMRRLVLTRTYRQSSVASPELLRRDPYNKWFARQSRFRLPAEMVRDNALSIGGLMVQQVGGASVKPYQPAGYYRHLNFPKRVYVPHTDARQWRRGVYVHWQRQFLHPMLKAMDAPSREECTAERPRSNTPLEALVLLNDPTMVEAAICLAQRMLASSKDVDQRLRDAFLLATSREPDKQESKLLRRMLVAELAHYRDQPAEATDLIESAGDIVDSKSHDDVELAAWTGVCRAILNMYETVTRN